MNSSNDTPQTSTGGITSSERYFQYSMHAFCNSIALVGHLLIAVGLARSKQIKTRFYYIMIFLSLARALFCAQLFSTIVYRVLKTFDLIPYPTRLGCSLLAVIGLPSALELLMLNALALDRAVALFAITLYRRLSETSVVYQCSTAVLLCFVFKLALIFGDPPLSSIVQCFSIYDAAGQLQGQINQHSDTAMLVLLLVVYAGIIIALRVRIRFMQNKTGNDANSAAIQRQMALMPTLRNVVVTHCAWTLTAKLMFSIALSPGVENYAARLILYGGCFTASEQLLNVIILIYANKDIREATLGIKTTNSVSIVSIPQSRLNTRV